MTTNFAPCEANAAAAWSSLGSGSDTATLHRAQKADGLRGEALATAQQLTEGRIDRRSERKALLGAQPCPLGAVTRFQQSSMRTSHVADGTPLAPTATP